ncbi:MAG: spore coat U domain-containing protein [Candidatus Mariimomonas ferrooxydans]
MKKGFQKATKIILIVLVLSYANGASAACNVSTTPVNFGSYDIFSTAPLDSTGSITVACDEQPAPTVTIAIGPSPNSGGFNPRQIKLTTGSDLLNYNLYTNNNRTRIWGDGSGSTSTMSKKVKRNKPWTPSVFGRIPPIQDVLAGLYTETLAVTITW